MAFHWRADDAPTLNAGLVAAIFQGIRNCIARKPYIFVIFHGGGGGSGPPVPPLDPHMLTPPINKLLKLWLPQPRHITHRGSINCLVICNKPEFNSLNKTGDVSFVSLFSSPEPLAHNELF